MAGLPNPTEDKLVRTVMAGIRRVKGTAQRGKEPLSPDLLRRMLEHAGPGPRGLRDRALLLVGFAGAFRRGELVSLLMEDVRETEEGLIITIPRSKTDPEGSGQTVGIPYGSHPETCPVRALRAWLECANITAGYLFPALGRWEKRAVAPGLAEPGREAARGAQPGGGGTGSAGEAQDMDVAGAIGGGERRARAGAPTAPLGELKPLCDHQLARIIKRLAACAGLEPAAFSGHSLRSGLATSAAEGGATERAIMDQTRHRSLKQVRKYIRRGSLFKDNAAARCGL